MGVYVSESSFFPRYVCAPGLFSLPAAISLFFSLSLSSRELSTRGPLCGALDLARRIVVVERALKSQNSRSFHQNCEFINDFNCVQLCVQLYLPSISTNG